MPRFAEIVKKEAEFIRAMKEAGKLTEREVELLELVGLDLDEERKDQEPHKIPGSQRSVIMFSKPVKTMQDRLRP